MSDLQGDSYYRCLQLDEAALRKDIVRAYRRLALGVHPDARPGDPAAASRFRAITEAYEVLADPERRAAYDRQVHGARIPVHVADQAARRIGRAHTAEMSHGEGRPIVIGSPSRSPARAPAFRVGPARVERATRGGQDASRSAAYDLVWRIIEEWGWR